jgi:hypothetical protein
MSIVLTIMLIMMMNVRIDMIEISYEGISITWRRLASSKSNIINLEMIIIIALSDKSFDLCDSYHYKVNDIGSDFVLECIESWDNCLSWPFHTLSLQCSSKNHGELFDF